MENFMNAMKQTAVNDVNYNMSVTENGAIGFKTLGKNLLDINFAVASLRSANEKEILDKFDSAWNEDPILAFTWLFYVRDIREGLGERNLFRICVKDLFTDKKVKVTDEQLTTLLKLILEYGRADDIYSLTRISDKIDKVIGKFIKDQLVADLEAMKQNKPVSLLSKWLKTESASSKESKKLAIWTRDILGLSSQKYRKTLSTLRKYIDVVEVKMSSNNWNEIDYEKVPSRASLLYKTAFYTHDTERYTNYIESVNKGEAKINSTVLYPHDIVSKYVENGWSQRVKALDNTLEALWKNLPDTVKGNGNTLVVADGSGSMTARIGNTSISALDVANALAIYFSERASGPYKDKYITFSENPQFVDFSNCNTLRAKISEALKHNECANTNIQKVFELILNTAIRNNCKQEDLPTNILILSDMEFDAMTTFGIPGSWRSTTTQKKALFQELSDLYAQHGYKLPRLVFWNLNSRTKTIPVTQNELGVALISGFSTNLAKMVMDNETDPYKCLLNVLLSKRYEEVKKLTEKIV